MATKKTVNKTTKAKAKAKAKAKVSKTTAVKTKTVKRTKVAHINLPAAPQRPTTRRPPNNPQMPEEIIILLTANLNDTKLRIEQYAAHLRSLDRKRLNGVGIKKRGFIDAALALAEENPEFLPHWLPIDDFRDAPRYAPRQAV